MVLMGVSDVARSVVRGQYARGTIRGEEVCGYREEPNVSPDSAVETFVAACMRGPVGARITNVELHRAAPPEEKGFQRKSSF